MTAFKFRLEAALRLRRFETEQERSKLQSLIAQQQRLEKSLAALWQERDEAAEFVRSASEPVAQDVRALALFSIGLKSRARVLEDAIADLGRQVAEQKRKVLAAQRAERCLEKLREKRFAEWNLNVMHEIEATAQELWLAAHTNNVDARSDGASA